MKIIPTWPRASLPRIAQAKWVRIKYILLVKKIPHLYKNWHIKNPLYSRKFIQLLK